MTNIWIGISFIFMLIPYPENPTTKRILANEICDNALDDDTDGLIDINDPDCICERVTLESLIPNPSFEEYDCCPEDHSQLACAVGWDQASGGTTDYVHTCGYLSAGEALMPFPDGEGAVIFLTGTVDNGNGSEIYKEYAGVCLNRPMQKDTVYRFKFHLGFFSEENSPEIRLSFFGSPSCANLPFSFFADCPTNYPDWHFLAAEFVSSSSNSPEWVEVDIVIQPSIDINALVIGGDCSGGSNGQLYGYLIDNLQLSDESNFDFELIDQLSPCDPDFTFTVADNPVFSYQWYKAGIALIGETDAQLSQMYGEGAYQLRITDNISEQCRLADDFEFQMPVLTTEVYESICEGESLLYEGDVIEDAGTYEYTLTSSAGCDSIVTLQVEKLPHQTDTVFVQTLQGAIYQIGDTRIRTEGEHHINLISPNGCDSSVVLYLEHLKVYIPNAFSPNGDDINDYFEVITSGDEFVIKEMSIFNQWGNLIYVGDKWDGTYRNKRLPPDVYACHIRLIDMTGKEWIFSTTITLIR